MTSTPLIESHDQTPEPEDSVLLKIANVDSVLEQEYESRKQACEIACENVHQQYASRIAETLSVYYELVADAHKEGFSERDIAAYLLRGHTP